MNTKIVKSGEAGAIEEGARLLASGALVAFPTETVYGLGANGLDEEAAAAIYRAKGRPSDNPLILHIAALEQADGIAYLDERAIKAAEFFWPGPLTLVLPKKKTVPRCITGGLNTVAVRMPSNQVARRLIELANVPVAAPSANLSGKPSPTTAQAVYEDMAGKIPLIIDGGPCAIGIESTVLDLSAEMPMILRPGGITLEQLQKVLPDCELEPGLIRPGPADYIPKAPGMKYKHYSPDAQVYVFEGQKSTENIKKMAAQEIKEGKKIGIYCPDSEYYEADFLLHWGKTAEDMAHRLFQDLREFDRLGAETVLCKAPERSQMGDSVRNRLYKAAGYKIIE